MEGAFRRILIASVDEGLTVRSALATVTRSARTSVLLCRACRNEAQRSEGTRPGSHRPSQGVRGAGASGEGDLFWGVGEGRRDYIYRD